jgi:hypothetical protein
MPIKFYGLDLDFLKSLDSPKNIDIYIDTQEYHHNNHRDDNGANHNR